MAKQHLAQAGNQQAERLRPAREPPLVLETKLPGGPSDDVLELFRDGARLPARHLLEHCNLAVALDELG